MTYIRSTVLPNGDVEEIRTNPGAAPARYVNGARQPVKETNRQWQKWFAWRPVRLNGKWIWLKWVYRYRTNNYVDYDDWARYEYGNILNVLKDS